jgi:hypothetical protein
MTDEQLQRDALSAEVDETLYAWLMSTAATAEDATDLTDFYAGVITGFARFFWDARREGVSPGEIAADMSRRLLAMLQQLEEIERAGHA